MAINEGLVLEQVKAAAERLKDPAYAQVAVGTFVQDQPDISRYLTAQLGDADGGESLMQGVFHLEFMRNCFEAAYGSPPPQVSFRGLDSVVVPDPLEKLGAREPALADYLVSNIDSDTLRKLIAQVTLAFHAAMETQARG